MIVLGVLLSSAWLACSSTDSGPAAASAGNTVAGTGAGGATPVASAGARDSAGAPSSTAGGNGSVALGGAASSAGGARSSGGSTGSASAGEAAVAGSAGVNSDAGAGGGSAGAPPSACNLSTPVTFQKDIQGFLAKSCGKTVDGGCHVTDSSKTSLGYDHAYDWITAFAHTSSCGKSEPYAKRFEVVLALLAGPKPASCPNARQMPPQGMGEALTECQVAALQAWLAEPLVSQMHVPENDDTKALYPAGPYLMPPFN